METENDNQTKTSDVSTTENPNTKTDKPTSIFDINKPSTSRQKPSKSATSKPTLDNLHQDIIKQLELPLSQMLCLRSLSTHFESTFVSKCRSSCKLILFVYNSGSSYYHNDEHLCMAQDLDTYRQSREKDEQFELRLDCTQLTSEDIASYAELFEQVTELTICLDGVQDKIEPFLCNFLTGRLVKFNFVVTESDSSLTCEYLSRLYHLFAELITPERMPILRELHLWIGDKWSSEQLKVQMHKYKFDEPTPEQRLELNLSAIMPQLHKLTLNCYCANRYAMLSESNAAQLTHFTMNTFYLQHGSKISKVKDQDLVQDTNGRTTSFIFVPIWNLFMVLRVRAEKRLLISQRRDYVNQSLRDNVTHLCVTNLMTFDALDTILRSFPNITSLQINMSHQAGPEYGENSADLPFPVVDDADNIYETLQNYNRITELRFHNIDVDFDANNAEFAGVLPRVRKLTLCRKYIFDSSNLNAFGKRVAEHYPNLEELTLISSDVCSQVSDRELPHDFEEQLRGYYRDAHPQVKLTLDLSAPEFEQVVQTIRVRDLNPELNLFFPDGKPIT